MKIRFKFSKKPKQNIKKILKSILLVLVGAIFISTVLISLPLTERISDKVSFNLSTKNKDYWSKEYVVSVNTTDKKELRKIKQIIYKRLRNYGVEKVSIFSDVVSDTDSEFRIVVNTTKNKELVYKLVSNQHSFEIVTRKGDVNFEDTENPYAITMRDNYEDTEWDYNDFRTVYIPKSKLRTSDGGRQFFAIFKPWTNKQSALTSFLKNHKGELLGLDIDSFVYPFQVQDIDEDSINQETITIAVYVETEEEARVTSLLYNSGHIKVPYTLKEEINRETEIISLDYVKLSIGLAISLLTSYLYMLIFKYSSKENLLLSLFTTVITLSIYLAYLKLTHIAVDTFLLAIQFILMMIFIKAVSDNQDSDLFVSLILILAFILISLLGTGIMMTFAQGMIALIALAKVSSILTRWYIDNVKKI